MTPNISSDRPFTAFPNKVVYEEMFRFSILSSDIKTCRNALKNIPKPEACAALFVPIDNKFDIWFGNEKGKMTPLQIAVLNKNKPLVELLLEHEVPVNDQQILSESTQAAALHFACMQENDEIALLLLEKGSVDCLALTTPSFAKTLGFTFHEDIFEIFAIHLAVRFNLKEVVKELVRKDKNALNQKASKWYTPLHIAAFLGNKSMAELLLSLGAHKNIYNQVRRFPTTIASDRGYSDLAKILKP